jgi:hypothetical protein
VAPVAPARGQEAPACAPGSRALTGDWTTTETIDGQNTSFWRGTLCNRTLSFPEYLGDSTKLAHTLVLDPGGTELCGSWPLPFGPDEREVLRGQARCQAV